MSNIDPDLVEPGACRMLIVGEQATRLASIFEDGRVEIVMAKSHAQAEHLAAESPFDLLAFDGSHAEASDFSFRIRNSVPGLSLVAVLGKATSVQIAQAFELGVHEVVSGWMGSRETAARLARFLEPKSKRAPGVLEYQSLVVDNLQGEVRWNNVQVKCSVRERQVLSVLIAAQGQAVRRHDIYRKVWGFAMARGDRSVDVNIKRIRSKLRSAGVELEIQTQPNIGYRLIVLSPVTTL